MKDFEVLSRDTVVAIWKDNKLIVLNNDLLPLYLKRISNAESWLETRAIDSHRPNSRLLKKALRLAEKDDVSTVLHVNAATITDTYWVREIGSSLKYEDIRFTKDYFSNLALRGLYSSFNSAARHKDTKTPELTNIGSFEKCWKLKDGKWWIYKSANQKEQFSELFIYELGKAFGMNMAHYEKGVKCVKSLDFTDYASVIFEPASSFMGDEEDYIKVVEKLKELCPKAIPDYIKMIFLDTITANPDRHTANFGLMRDAKNGELLGLAPNFDNNMALIARGYPTSKPANDLLITLFNELMDNFPEYKKFLPKVTEQMIMKVISKINMKVKSQVIVDFVIKRYQAIK
ncbi:MAG: hypothetical protein IKD04_03880 [Clostridia bacterium]|nr:hypothetical protein [Clostridia bacterium]